MCLMPHPKSTAFCFSLHPLIVAAKNNAEILLKKGNEEIFDPPKCWPALLKKKKLKAQTGLFVVIYTTFPEALNVQHSGEERSNFR